MENNIPTAEEFFKEELSGEPLTQESVEEALVNFAKLHLQAQQEAILEKVRANHIECWGQRTGDIEIDKDSIINAYPLNLIK